MMIIIINKYCKIQQIVIQIINHLWRCKIINKILILKVNIAQWLWDFFIFTLFMQNFMQKNYKDFFFLVNDILSKYSKNDNIHEKNIPNLKRKPIISRSRLKYLIRALQCS